MIAFPSGTKVWIAGGVTDMRKGMNTLSLQVRAKGLVATRMRVRYSVSGGAKAIW